jgi:DnaJ-class molecular chaperone
MSNLLWFDVAEGEDWNGYGEPELRADALAKDAELLISCPVCNGLKEVEGHSCERCAGKGFIKSDITEDARKLLQEGLDAMLADTSYKDE